MRMAVRVAAALLFGLAAALAWLIASVPRAAVPGRAGFSIAHATLVEPAVGRRSDQTLRVRDGRIAAVEPSGPEEKGGAWDGLYVIPGLVDLHVHLPPRLLPPELRAVLLLFLAHGVTSVRDAGSPWSWSLTTRREVNGARLAGPRVFSCGPLLVGVASTPGAIVIDDPSAAREVIARLRAERVDCVKVLDNVSQEVATAVRDAAHDSGLRVIGHVPTASSRPLLDEVQHLTGLESTLRTRHPAAVAKAVEDSLEGGTAHTPTLVLLERFARASEGEKGCRASCAALPGYFESVLWDPARIPVLAAMTEDRGFAPRARFEAAKAMVGALEVGGVTILAGTDSPLFYNLPGASLQEEVALLHEAGLTAENALAAATTRAAAALPGSRSARLAVGEPADLVLLGTDPIAAIEAGRPFDIAAVVVGGRLYSSESLAAELRELQQFFDSSIYSASADVAIRFLIPGSSPP